MAFQSVVKGMNASPLSPQPCWDSSSLTAATVSEYRAWSLLPGRLAPQLTISFKTAHQAPLISYSLWYDGDSVLLPSLIYTQPWTEMLWSKASS